MLPFTVSATTIRMSLANKVATFINLRKRRILGRPSFSRLFSGPIIFATPLANFMVNSFNPPCTILVETIGKCYVAVAGLPDPRPDHAIARFETNCLKRFMRLTKQMEVTLGPDTAGLGIQVGLHSCPVTVGVLRGRRARFQLFKNTVNTSAQLTVSSRHLQASCDGGSSALIQLTCRRTSLCCSW